MSDVMCVFVTASSIEEGRRVARALLDDRVAACVNLVPGVESHYWWDGKIENAPECILVIKTRAALLPRLVERVKATHSYSVPEVIAMPVVGGSDDYLSWVRHETSDSHV